MSDNENVVKIESEGDTLFRFYYKIIGEDITTIEIKKDHTISFEEIKKLIIDHMKEEKPEKLRWSYRDGKKVVIKDEETWKKAVEKQKNPPPAPTTDSTTTTVVDSAEGTATNIPNPSETKEEQKEIVVEIDVNAPRRPKPKPEKKEPVVEESLNDSGSRPRRAASAQKKSLKEIEVSEDATNDVEQKKKKTKKN